MNSFRIRCRASDAVTLLCHHLRDCKFSHRSIADMRILTFSRSYFRIGKELTAVFTVTPDENDQDLTLIRLSMIGLKPDSCAAVAKHICAGELAATVKFDLGASRDMLGGLMKALEAYRI